MWQQVAGEGKGTGLGAKTPGYWPGLLALASGGPTYKTNGLHSHPQEGPMVKVTWTESIRRDLRLPHMAI